MSKNLGNVPRQVKMTEEQEQTFTNGINKGRKLENERIKKLASDIYPADVFPEPDWEQVRSALAGIGITLDAVAGSLLRRQIPVIIEGENE